jgi:hypothetical protein
MNIYSSLNEQPFAASICGAQILRRMNSGVASIEIITTPTNLIGSVIILQNVSLGLLFMI